MSFYGIDHPNHSKPQLSCPRRAEPSGTVVVHTAEGALDAIAPDHGAENVANYLTQRTDAGSYHTIVDSDSVVRFAPPGCETWHIAVGHLNWDGWGISFACRTTDWGGPGKTTTEKLRDGLTTWDEHALALAAGEIAVYARWWASLKPDRDPMAVARHIAGGDAHARTPGLVGHGEAQPADRTDPFGGNPLEPQLWARLVHLVRDQLQPTTEDDMTPEQSAKLDAIHAALFDDSTGGGLITRVTDINRDTRIGLRSFWDPKARKPGDPKKRPVDRINGLVALARLCIPTHNQTRAAQVDAGDIDD